jgi:hypothetical protein
MYIVFFILLFLAESGEWKFLIGSWSYPEIDIAFHINIIPDIGGDNPKVRLGKDWNSRLNP